MALAPGSRIGLYMLQERLGHGRTGVVYKAVDLRSRAPRVLEIVPMGAVRDRDLERVRERVVHVASEVRHPNIVPVFDMGEDAGYLYLASEWCEGPTLQEVLRRRGPLPLREVVSIVEQIARAVDFAHSRALGEFDLKPSNVYLMGGGRVKTVVFDLAQALLDTSTLRDIDDVILGTPEYRAPELWRQRSNTGSADLYALGIMAYEMLAGHVPFQHDSSIALEQAHRSALPPPLHVVRPDLRAEVDDAIECQLAKTATMRFQSAWAFAKALGWAAQLVSPWDPPLTPSVGRGAPPPVQPNAGGPAHPPPPRFGSDDARNEPPPMVPQASPPIDTSGDSVGALYSVAPMGWFARAANFIGAVLGGRQSAAPTEPTQTQVAPSTLAGSTAAPPVAQSAESSLLAQLPIPEHQTPRPNAPPGPPADAVQCAVFAPPRVPQGRTFLVQVIAHQPAHVEMARQIASEHDLAATQRGSAHLAIEVERGAVLGFELRMRELEILDEARGSTVWRGQPTPVSFEVRVPEAQPLGSTTGRLLVNLDGLTVGDIRFQVEVVAATAAQGPLALEPGAIAARRFAQAFVSYASADRVEVLKRVQGLRRAGIHCFQDILDLEPGQRWERELYRRIDDSDLFYLFWSRAARDSEWVQRELAYALRRKQQDDEHPPLIQPIPLEGPAIVPPPPELAHLHFDDTILQYIEAQAVRLGTNPPGSNTLHQPG